MQIRLIFLLYRTLQIAALPFLSLYFVWRCLRDRRYIASFGERLGFLPASFQRTVPGAVWLHAVSVGEVLSARQLISRLRERLPGIPVYISCGTIAGKNAMPGAFYVPLDYVSAVRRVLRTIRPSVVVVLETEIWPNLYREVRASGAGLVIVNGRISAKAIPSYLRFRWFFGPVLSLPNRILAQSDRDREHYGLLGAEAESAGNLKYDFAPSDPPDDLRRYFEGRPGPVWIAASTVAPNEDDAVIAAYQELLPRHPDLTLAIAPRKPERFDIVAEKLRAARLDFARRTALKEAPVLLLDSIGELGSLFRFATVVFMGGTLAERGGHNILEPAIAGKPVIAGPHLENFAEIAERFRAANAYVEIKNAEELAPAVERLLKDTEMGERGRITAAGHAGATDRAAEAIVEVHDSALPNAIPYGPAKPVLRMLAGAWTRGGEQKRRRDLSQQRSLGAPVVSIGGIAMGGTGKTPFVAHLARTLKARGHNPAILTRGYKRISSDPVLVFGAGETGAPDITGDEAQILLRTGAAHVGIAADRYAAGRLLEERFAPGIFLLDDGFQHARLSRDLDIVLIDSLDPFAGGGVFPLGRLREPLSALARADIIVITRAEQSPSSAALRMIREHNPHAPLFRSYTEPIGWRNAAVELDRAVSFCGLGNPGSFELTLRRLGCEPLRAFAFGDHHRYSANELRTIGAAAVEAGATSLLTTEKDFMNLPPDYSAAIGGLSLSWLEIGLRIEGEDELIGMVEHQLSAKL